MQHSQKKEMKITMSNTLELSVYQKLNRTYTCRHLGISHIVGRNMMNYSLFGKHFGNTIKGKMHIPFDPAIPHSRIKRHRVSDPAIIFLRIRGKSPLYKDIYNRILL